MREQGWARTGDKGTIRIPIPYLGASRSPEPLPSCSVLDAAIPDTVFSLRAHQTHVTPSPWIHGSQRNAGSRWARRGGEIRPERPAVRGPRTSRSRRVFVPQLMIWIPSVRLRIRRDRVGGEPKAGARIPSSRSVFFFEFGTEQGSDGGGGGYRASSVTGHQMDLTFGASLLVVERGDGVWGRSRPLRAEADALKEEDEKATTGTTDCR